MNSTASELMQMPGSSADRIDSLRYVVDELMHRRMLEGPGGILQVLVERGSEPEPTLRRMVRERHRKHHGLGLAGSREWKRLKRYRREHRIGVPPIFPQGGYILSWDLASPRQGWVYTFPLAYEER